MLVNKHDQQDIWVTEEGGPSKRLYEAFVHDGVLYVANIGGPHEDVWLELAKRNGVNKLCVVLLYKLGVDSSSYHRLVKTDIGKAAALFIAAVLQGEGHIYG